MTIPDAAALIRKLLAGVDPDTGEVLPEEHLLHDSSVREALLTALQAMSAQNKTGSVMTTRSGRLNAGRPWTTEDLADLRQLYESGMSIDEIARLTHRRARGIRLQLNLMAGGGKRRDERAEIPETIGADSLDAMAPPGSRSGPVNSHQPWPPAQDASLAEMFRAGESIPQLAEAFGRSPHAIVKRLQKLGLLLDEESPDSPTRAWTEKDITLLRRLHESGLPVLHIAARLNRTEAAISARLFYMGLGGSAPSLFPEEAPPPPPPEDALSADPPLPEKVAAAVSPSRRWTPEEDAYLRRAWARGEPLETIVRRTGRRDRLVRCRLIFLGAADHSLLGGPTVPPELAHQGLPWYPEEVEALHRMFQEGRSAEAMAAELKRSVGVVRSRLDMLGLTEDTPE